MPTTHHRCASTVVRVSRAGPLGPPTSGRLAERLRDPARSLRRGPLRRALVALLLLLAPGANAERIKDIAKFGGVRANSLVGYGVVVGLNGTGDDNLAYTIQSIRSAAQKLGVTLPPGVGPGLKNAAAVFITAELPAFAKPGQRIDVTAAAIGKAKSLRGGTLLMAPLVGADGAVYAMAQGSLAVGGLGVEGADGSKIIINVPSSGRIPDGATVERAVDTGFQNGGTLMLNLARADFTDATRVAAAINAQAGARARALDAVSVEVVAPADTPSRVALMSRIEGIDLAMDVPVARVIVNARTGTIVIGAGVRVSPAAVAHGNLTVRISEDPFVSQPREFSRGGQTVVVPDSKISVEEEPARAFLFAPGVALSDLVEAINKVGAAPSDLVAILEALKQAGALKAELVVI